MLPSKGLLGKSKRIAAPWDFPALHIITRDKRGGWGKRRRHKSVEETLAKRASSTPKPNKMRREGEEEEEDKRGITLSCDHELAGNRLSTIRLSAHPRVFSLSLSLALGSLRLVKFIHF